MKLKLSFWNVLIILSLFSCGLPANRKEAAPEYLMESNDAIQQASNQKIEIPDERKIIKNGNISFETWDVKETESFIKQTVNELGGYISNDNVYISGDRITHSSVVRIPADRFDVLLQRISESATKIDRKNIDVQDVTEEYIDIEARIKTKKELENRYRELLKQARKVEEILAIEKESGTLRAEIESMEGRLKYLKNQIGFSTLSIEYYEITKSSFGFSTKFGRAMEKGWDWLLAFLIGVVHLWPFILTGLVIFLAYSFGKKRKK